MIIAKPMTASVTPPPTEGNFDFVVDTGTYAEPSGEGAFDFKVA
jgi:hypothetical protein